MTRLPFILCICRLIKVKVVIRVAKPFRFLALPVPRFFYLLRILVLLLKPKQVCKLAGVYDDSNRAQAPMKSIG
jgi:hypothetical protein